MHTCSCTLRVQLHVCTYVTSTFVKHLANGSLTTHRISAQSVQPFRRYAKRGAHVHLCSTMNFARSLASGSLTTHQISAQSVLPFPRYGKGGTSARAHVQMYPTHDLCNMHRGLVSKHTPNFVTISPSIPELKLRANFDTRSHCTCHVPQWLPRWIDPGSIHGRQTVTTQERKQFVKRTCGC